METATAQSHHTNKAMSVLKTTNKADTKVISGWTSKKGETETTPGWEIKPNKPPWGQRIIENVSPQNDANGVECEIFTPEDRFKSEIERFLLTQTSRWFSHL